MISDRPIMFADDTATVGRLTACKETCQRFIATLDRCPRDNAEMVSFTDLYAPGPRFQRRFTTDGDHDYRTVDVTVELEEIGGKLEVDFYLSSIPGQPSYRIAETLFADGSNRPDHEGSTDDLKAIFERYFRFADERLAGPITNPIRAQDLPDHLTALIRSRLGPEVLSDWPCSTSSRKRTTANSMPDMQGGQRLDRQSSRPTSSHISKPPFLWN